MSCYEAISTLSTTVRQDHYPNLEAMAHSVALDGDMKELVQYARSCVHPGIMYYFNQLGASMKGPLEAFKAERFFSPAKVQQMRPSLPAVDTLSFFPF